MFHFANGRPRKPRATVENTPRIAQPPSKGIAREEVRIVIDGAERMLEIVRQPRIHGQEAFWLCPRCGALRWHLYVRNGEVGCRQCLGLSYACDHTRNTAALRARGGSAASWAVYLACCRRSRRGRRIGGGTIGLAGLRSSLRRRACSLRGLVLWSGGGEVSVSDVRAVEERDEAVVEAITAGRSLRAVRKEFGLTVTEFDQALERCFPLDVAARMRMIRADLAKLDKLINDALKQDDPHWAAIAIKAWERKHDIAGMSTVTRIDLTVAPKEAETGFQKIRAAIFEVARDPAYRPKANGGALVPPLDPSADDENCIDSDEFSPSKKD